MWRLLGLDSGLPVLTCRKCDARLGPRRGAEGGMADIGSLEPLGFARNLNHFEHLGKDATD